MPAGEVEKREAMYKRHAFEEYVSDLISPNRSLPDWRGDWCRTTYDPLRPDLDPTSVVICFHNEAWSTLVGTNNVLYSSRDNPTSVVDVAGGAHSLSVAALVVASHGEGGVDVWVAVRFFTSLTCHSYSVGTPGAGVRIVKKIFLEHPITKFTLVILVGKSLCFLFFF